MMYRTPQGLVVGRVMPKIEIPPVVGTVQPQETPVKEAQKVTRPKPKPKRGK